MRVLDCAQRSDVWRQARSGRLGSSQAADAMAMLKNGSESAGRRDLKIQLVLERITSQSQDSGYVNADMQRGIDCEPLAIAAYEAAHGVLVEPIGLILHDELLTSYSPDGFVNDDGIIEVKCPRSATHLGYLRAGTVPKEYLPQLTHALWITDRRWIDFISFDDRFPEPLRLFQRRLLARDVDLAAWELNVRLFLSEVERELDAVQALMHATV